MTGKSSMMCGLHRVPMLPVYSNTGFQLDIVGYVCAECVDQFSGGYVVHQMGLTP